MCLTIEIEEKYKKLNDTELANAYTKVLEEDKVVYKVVRTKTLHNCQSLYRKFNYEYGKRYHINSLNVIIYSNTLLNIFYGFHAYTSLEEAKKEKSPYLFNPDIIIVKCTYPKGSKIIEDKFSECAVSDTIIINYGIKI